MLLRAVILLLLLFAPAGQALAAGAIEVGILTFRVPASWEQVPAGPRRDAEFRIPSMKDLAGAEGRVIFRRFPEGQGDKPAAHVKRWLTLFVEDAVEHRVWTEKVAGCTVQLLEASGTFLEGEADGEPVPRPDHTLVAAAFQTRRGVVLVRMVAPTPMAKRDQDAFLAMVRGAIDGWKTTK